jgi:hypothetical protein
MVKIPMPKVSAGAGKAPVPRKVAPAEGELEKETRLYSVKDLPAKLPSGLYVPEDEEAREQFSEKSRGYWDTYRPKSAFDYATYAVSPAGYMLWKMPPETHSKVNSVLGGAAGICTLLLPVPGVGEAAGIGALVTGILYAISQTVYGIKTKSGKHVTSGLEGIVANTKKIDLANLTKDDAKTVRNTYKNAKSLLAAIAGQNAAEN